MAASKKWRSAELTDRLRSFLADRQALSLSVCVALSGGRDSVSLLHMAWAAELTPRLSALHVNHGISARAGEWEGHCRRLCENLGVPLTTVRVNVDRRSGAGLEAAAREARYAAFARCDSDVLLLAHHQGDQAETVLFNLFRGAGLAGLSGMRDERNLGPVRLMRPLLAVDPDAVADYAFSHELSWVEDESNADVSFSRNFLRHEVLPGITDRFPAAAARLESTAAHCAEAGRLLDELARIDASACDSGGQLSVAKLRNLSPERVKNLLRWRLAALAWRAPGAVRLEEFVRQLLECRRDRHPELLLVDGSIRVRRGRLCWEAHSGA